MNSSSAEECWAHLWSLIEDGVVRRKSEYHLAVLSNVRRDGVPQARTVVSRYCDADKVTVGFHTDARSARVQDLVTNPIGQMLYYGPTANVQIRLTGQISVHVGDSVAKAAWELSPAYSRKCYMFPVPSSEPLLEIPEPSLTNPGLPETEVAFPNFAVVHIQATEIEYLNLAAAGHLRWKWVQVGTGWEPMRLSP